MKLTAIKVVLISFCLVGIINILAFAKPPGQAQATVPLPAKIKMYNLAKAKLLEGKQIFSFTQDTFDPAGYCEKAKHYDYTWFEMQHSVLEFRDIQQMMAACPHSHATPMIRLPDAQEMRIQHSTDIGVLGVIIPTVDDVDRTREAVKWSRYPPVARRSTGAGQAVLMWGDNEYGVPPREFYARTANENMMVTIMIETPTGVSNAFDIASIPGVDVVIIGNNDMSVFSGFSQNDDRYHQLIQKVHDDVLRAGKIFGQANNKYATGPYSKDSYMFQGGPAFDGWTPATANGVPKNEQ